MTDQVETTTGEVPANEVVVPQKRLHVLHAPVNANPLGALPASLGVCGTCTLLLGAWAAIVVYVGPSFGYSVDGTTSWTWTLGHLVAALAPGVVAMLAGLMMFGAAKSTVAGAGRARLTLAGLLAILAGAWLAFAPVAWPVIDGSSRYYSAGSPFHLLAAWAGSALGPGLLIVIFGAFATGWARRHIAGEMTLPATATAV